MLRKEYDGLRHFASRDLLFIIFNHVLGIVHKSPNLTNNPGNETKSKRLQKLTKAQAQTQSTKDSQKEKIETIKMY